MSGGWDEPIAVEAERQAQSFINGNRSAVVKVLCAEKPRRQALLMTCLVYEKLGPEGLGDLDMRRSFLRALETG